MENKEQIIINAINSYSDIIESEYFYLQHGKDALESFEQYQIDRGLIDDILNQGAHSCYSTFCNDHRYGEIKELLFRFVAYCDSKAKDKNTYNEYEAKQTVAMAGIRQNAWVYQLLKYKIGNIVSESINNAISFIKDPANNFPILSEKHREQIYRYFFNEDYNKQRFNNRLIEYFNNIHESKNDINKENRTYLFTRIIYDNLKHLWNPPTTITGLLNRDRYDWKKNFIDGVDEQGYAVVWWHKNVQNHGKVYKVLREIIDEGGTFYYYIVENNNVRYRANVIDFALKKNWDEKRDGWRAKTPYGYGEEFDDYCDDDKTASILLLVDSFVLLNEAIGIDRMETYDNRMCASNLPSVGNMIAIKRIVPIKDEKMAIIEKILREKKQIILQGAPGTGKTYSTAALALSIIGEKYDSNNHDEIMEKYHRLVDEKRIFFTTFHQSMDYEDFVEGLRPKIVGDNVSYYVKDGIFKLACISAIEQDSMDDLDVAIENLKEECFNNSITLETKTRKKEIRVSYRENKNVFDIRPTDSEANRKDPYRADINDIKRYHIENGEIGSHNLPYIRTIYDYLVEKYDIKPYQKKENQHNNQNYVLIIDEINRGNISKIFGELITLLESDKRQGGSHSLSAILPYSNEKFSIPSNLFIIGTMNTTDRSVGYIDYAIRRRFAFYTLKASVDAVHSYYNQNKTEDEVTQKAIKLFNSINEYMMADKNTSSDIDAEDLMIGHSYFMAKDIDKLKMKLEYEIIPLLREYQKDGIILVKIEELKNKEIEWKKILE